VLCAQVDELAEYENRPAFKQVRSANDTAKFLEDLARTTKKLVDNFIVRVMNPLSP
jgi:hypothetical protein